MNKFPHTMDEERFEATFNGILSPALFEYGLRVQQRGVEVQVAPGAAEAVRERPSAQPPRAEHELEVMVEVSKDFCTGGLMLLPVTPEAAEAGQFEGMATSPMSLVPKSNLDGSPSGSHRMAHHQSWPPGQSVNDFALKDRRPPSHPPTHQAVTRVIIHMAVTNPGLDI